MALGAVSAQGGGCLSLQTLRYRDMCCGAGAVSSVWAVIIVDSERTIAATKQSRTILCSSLPLRQKSLNKSRIKIARAKIRIRQNPLVQRNRCEDSFQDR